MINDIIFPKGKDTEDWSSKAGCYCHTWKALFSYCYIGYKIWKNNDIAIKNIKWIIVLMYFLNMYKCWYNSTGLKHFRVHFISGRGHTQACSQGVQGVWHTPPNLPKGPLLATKWVINGVFVIGLRGWGSKSPLFGSKRSTFRGFCTPKNWSWLWAWSHKLRHPNYCSNTTIFYQPRPWIIGIIIKIVLGSHVPNVNNEIVVCSLWVKLNSKQRWGWIIWTFIMIILPSHVFTKFTTIVFWKNDYDNENFCFFNPLLK